MKMSNTSERLKELMKTKNLKQVDILELCKPISTKYGIGVNKNDLSQYISGKSEPGSKKLAILGIALNVNESWLMGFDVSMERGSINLLSEKEELLLDNYNKLNDLGQKEAIKRVSELTEIDKYTRVNIITMAAHNDDNSEEQQELMMKDFEEMDKW